MGGPIAQTQLSVFELTNDTGVVDKHRRTDLEAKVNLLTGSIQFILIPAL